VPAEASARATAILPTKTGPLTAARRDTLHKYDLDGNGKLDVAEEQRMTAERKARVEALRARINSRYDQNGNGVIEPDELRALQADRDKLSVFKGAAMRRHDANHDGVLDPDERQRMRTERQAFLKGAQGKLLAKFDTNHDGKLDAQERAAKAHQLAPKTTPTK
jgi:Ca2+-binding EF-hand superfamily protein